MQEGQMCYRCPGCDAIYHSECATESAQAKGRCGVLGCAAPIPLVREKGTSNAWVVLAAVMAVGAILAGLAQAYPTVAAPVAGALTVTFFVGFLLALVAAAFPAIPRSFGRFVGRVRRLFSRRRGNG
jgi:hypothetical protein